MSQVTGEYPDSSKRFSTGDFSLDADQPFNVFTWMAPIQWKGLVDGKKVEFVQVNNSASSHLDFNFESFPEELKKAIPYIVKAINSAMRTMN